MKAKFITLLVAALAASQAQALCFDDAAKRYSVDPNLLRAIAKTESNFNPKAKNVNKNGSMDIGVMQINDSWLPRLQRYGITQERLFKEPCVNVHVGAWILAHNIARYGNTWKAVGAYNARTPSKQEVYVKKVWRNAQILATKGAPA